MGDLNEKEKFECFLIGGLGNQIFQHVLLSWIQEYLNKELILYTSDYSILKNLYRNFRGIQPLYFYDWLIKNKKFNNKLILIKRMKVRINDYFPGFFNGLITNKVIGSLDIKKTKKFTDLFAKSYFLKSHCIYPQLLNYKYFYPYWQEIGEIITENIIKKNQKFEPNVFDLTIHIRKGDYLKGGKNIYAVVTEKYYLKAIKLIIKKRNFKRRPKCLIIGNDINWAKSFLSDELIDITYQFKSEMLDFYAISNCKNLILANSSFSYAAAMVAMLKFDDSLIICPKEYYKGIYKNKYMKNKNWITIKND
mgnify:CR=1 FL=1